MASNFTKLPELLRRSPPISEACCARPMMDAADLRRALPPQRRAAGRRGGAVQLPALSQRPRSRRAACVSRKGNDPARCGLYLKRAGHGSGNKPVPYGPAIVPRVAIVKSSSLRGARRRRARSSMIGNKLRAPPPGRARLFRPSLRSTVTRLFSPPASVSLGNPGIVSPAAGGRKSPPCGPFRAAKRDRSLPRGERASPLDWRKFKSTSATRRV